MAAMISPGLPCLNGRINASVLQSACFFKTDMRLMTFRRCESEIIRYRRLTAVWI